MKKIKRNSFKIFIAIAVVVLVVAIGQVTIGIIYAAGTSGPEIYLAPSSGTYTVGSTLSVAVRENGEGTAINSTQVGLDYSSSNLQFSSIDGTGSAFASDVSPATQNAGEVIISRFSTSNSYTTDELIATVNFTVTAAGTATMTFTSSCQTSANSDCTGLGSSGNSVAITTTGGSYTLQAASAPNSSGSPTPSPTPSSTKPTSSTSTPNAASSTAKSTSSSITPQSSTTPITVPTGSQVQVSTPATIEPATIQPDGVKDIQYYLNNKLVYTATIPPYSYHLDTTNLLNGTYAFKTVSYYVSGRTSVSTQKLIVRNPFSLTQLRLLLKHYSPEIIPPLVIIIIGLLAWLSHDGWRHWSNRRRFGSSSTPTLNNGQIPTVIVG